MRHSLQCLGSRQVLFGAPLPNRGYTNTPKTSVDPNAVTVAVSKEGVLMRLDTNRPKPNSNALQVLGT
jgi:hypothetical protein